MANIEGRAIRRPRENSVDTDKANRHGFMLFADLTTLIFGAVIFNRLVSTKGSVTDKLNVALCA